MNSLEKKELDRLLHLFNSLQSDDDRFSFHRQWKTFVHPLSTEDQRNAYKKLSEAVISGLQDFAHTLQNLTPEQRANAADFLANVPKPDEVMNKVKTEAPLQIVAA